jgi:putative alpha-1,2-mannosidase
VPHDETGLRTLLGGDGPFADKLTSFFQQAKDSFSFYAPTGFYYQGNEPDIHAAYLFIRAGRPDLTQDWATWARQASYLNQPGGLTGNDDAGTMGAWYVFTGTGLYPWPCLSGYYITAPMFDRVVLHLAGGDVTIDALGAGSGKHRVTSATWNGKALDVMWIDHADLARGGTLTLGMAD